MTNKPDIAKGGDSMQSTNSTTKRNGKGALMAGMATASFLKDLNLEDDEAATSQPAPHETSLDNHKKNSPHAAMPHAMAEAAPIPSGDVDDYMKQLFTRLRGGDKPVPAQPAKQQPVASSSASSTPVQSAPAPVMMEKLPEPVEPLKDGEFIPIAKAPGRHVNISALRDLANQATNSAIQVFAVSQKKSHSLTNLTGVVGGIAGAIVFGILAAKLGTMFYMMSVVCICVSIFTGYTLFVTNNKKGQPSGSR